MKKNFLTILALILVYAMALTGCGSQEAAETTAAAPSADATPSLGLSDFSLTTTTWTSPNGATVNLTATPFGYAEGYSAAFIVRLEGEDVANVPCTWDGTNYTASADLNAADGLCYYVLLTAADGNTAEVPINTLNVPTDTTLIDLASALNSYCSLVVDSSSLTAGKLTIAAGTVQVRVPQISNDGQPITVTEAALALTLNGEEVSSRKLDLTAESGNELPLADITLDVPELENDQQVALNLNVTLSNGQTLTASGGTFYYNDGEMLASVG